jgi:cytosine/creatinine deaminase
MDLILRRARVEGHDHPVDIALKDGRIDAVEPTLELSAEVELQVDGRLASPAFVEPHIHLDKVGVLSILPPNRSGTLAEAISVLHQSKRAATAPEIAERAGRVIRQAVIAGTTTFRTHVDVDTIGGLRPLQGVVQARAEHADLCDIEIVAFPQEGIERDPGTDELMREAMRAGADVVGGMPHWERDRDSARRHIEFCLDLAVEHDAPVDMHVDETDDPSSRTLELLIDAAEARSWGPRTNAGHCCAMASWEDEYAHEIIRRLAATGMSVVTNPCTNLLLQGREDHEPRRRGLPRVKELLAAGVTLGCGQDCVHDAFYPFGAADQLQVALILAHAAQLSMPPEIKAAIDMPRFGAARIVGINDYGIVPGGRGDLVVLDAATPDEALRLQAPRRWVIRGGRIVAETDTAVRLRRHT